MRLLEVAGHVRATGQRLYPPPTWPDNAHIMSRQVAGKNAEGEGTTGSHSEVY